MKITLASRSDNTSTLLQYDIVTQARIKLVGLVGPRFVKTLQGKLRNLWPRMNSFNFSQENLNRFYSTI